MRLRHFRFRPGRPEVVRMLVRRIFIEPRWKVVCDTQWRHTMVTSPLPAANFTWPNWSRTIETIPIAPGAEQVALPLGNCRAGGYFVQVLQAGQVLAAGKLVVVR